MNPPSDPHREIRELCERLFESQASEADIARIEALVLREPEARRFYIEYRHLHAALHQNAARLHSGSLSDLLAELPASDAHPAPPAPPSVFPRWTTRLLPLAALLVLSLAILTLSLPRLGNARTIATLEEAHHAKWDASSLPTETGSSLARGRLRLIQGFARIKFRRGAEVSLEGPAELELLGSNRCALHSGSIVAHVPESAHGFEVQTQNARLIDHGTDFGISADRSGSAQVQVLQGEVELRHGRTGETVRLLTNQSAQIQAATLRRGAPVSSDTELERPGLQPAPTATHALKRLNLTTASGSGAAAYVTSPDAKIHFSDTLLLVKHSTAGAFLRKAFLKFDLAPLGTSKVAQAELALQFEASGFGYAALTDRCQFAVYGLTDDLQDAWEPSTLSWKSAPAFAPEGDRADSNTAVLLGRFETPKGVVSGEFTLRSKALTAFLNRDANRVASLIVVRETAQPSGNSAVHGFAGNRHPSLPPPTLRLLLED
ncbi:MAG: hypothetical protein RLZZ244_441 [Verrucomicrobiota bacterium]|jgi:ferric-dicitrate binding protein FerR (iron transport regulator)